VASRKNLLASFQKIDQDKDGFLSREELTQMFETSEKKASSLWEEIFLEVDTDKDGRISMQEFMNNMSECIRRSVRNYETIDPGDEEEAPEPRAARSKEFSDF